MPPIKHGNVIFEMSSVTCLTTELWYWLCSFNQLHPALADNHYLRTTEENEVIGTAKYRDWRKEDDLARSKSPPGTDCLSRSVNHVMSLGLACIQQG